mmetsp:Transcript_16848/g.49602  ORF Transcript_16848/g.49602 Transcript_16848/m.49602 type:complete len:383 (-) Transcript_16848:1174-2322(-)
MLTALRDLTFLGMSATMLAANIGAATLHASEQAEPQYVPVTTDQATAEFWNARAVGKDVSLTHAQLDAWWVERTEVEYPMVSILTMNNGQRYTDENALLNALYQKYPREKLELIVLESNGQGPDPSWVAWSAGRGGLDAWSAADERLLNRASGPLRIIYRWYNSSFVCPDGRQQCPEKPKLGVKRNIALEIATGDVLINMDNDDVYHPNYVAYVVHHMRRLKWHEARITNHSEILINPDSSVQLAQSVDYFKGGHTVIITKILSKRCGYGAAFNQVEEGALWGCSRKTVRPDQRGVLGPSKGALGNRYLMIKSVNPLSVTAQVRTGLVEIVLSPRSENSRLCASQFTNCTSASATNCVNARLCSTAASMSRTAVVPRPGPPF